MVAVSDFSGLVISDWALARAAAMAPIESLERCIARLHFQEIEADGAGFRALGPDAMAGRLLGVLRHQPFQFGLGILVLQKGHSGLPKDPGEFRALDELMSTMRIASMRGRGGSAPNRRGGSPLSTQRQNFFSAVSSRCW